MSSGPAECRALLYWAAVQVAASVGDAWASTAPSHESTAVASRLRDHLQMVVSVIPILVSTIASRPGPQAMSDRDANPRTESTQAEAAATLEV